MTVEKEILARNRELEKLVAEKTAALELKNKELEIEAALEKVRAQALGLRNPHELAGICEVLYATLKSLGFNELRNTMINIHDDAAGSFLNYDFSLSSGKTVTNIFYNSHPVTENQVKQIKSSTDAFVQITISGNELDEWRAYRKGMGEEDDPLLSDIPALSYYLYSIETGSIGISTYHPVTEEKLNILKRFRNVFDFAYRRYIDVAQAEAQAREAEIELALERVRARTMAMQKSTELLETSLLLFQQLRELGETADQLSIGIVKEEEGIFELSTTVYGNQMLQTYKPRLDEPFAINKVYQGWKTKQKTVVVELAGEELKNYNIQKNYAIQQNSLLETKVFNEQITPEDRWIVSAACFSKGALIFSSAKEVTKERLQLLEKFAGVFEQTYTRFLDLQKAEAQAKEAQIEAALEKVRSRSLAMHNSEELKEVVATVFEKMNELHFLTDGGVSIVTEFKQSEYSAHWVAADSVGDPVLVKFPHNQNAVPTDFMLAKSNRTPFYSKKYTKEVNENFWKLNFEYGLYANYPDDFKNTLLNTEVCHFAVAFEENSAITVSTFKDQALTEEQITILQRFAKVFEQSYTRFLDLQKAEAQAREAQIEAALERIRSASMAMHSSEQLAGVIKTVTDQLQSLGFSFETANFITNFTDKGFNLWLSVPGVAHPSFIYVPYDDNAFFRFLQQGEALKKEFDTLTGDKVEKDKFFTHFFTKSEAGNIPDERKKYVFDKPGVGFTTAFRKHFYFTIVNYEGRLHSAEENSILSRFANVFEQSYTRFLDLQKAEAQAKEAQIEAGLERVRYSAMAMQSSEDVGAATAVVFNEISLLGVEAMRCGITIMHLDMTADVWAATAASEGKEMKGMGSINFNDHPLWVGLFDAWKNKEESYTYALKGDDLKSYYKILASSPNYDSSYIQNQEFPDHFFYASFFEQGAVFTFSLQLHDDEKRKVLKRFTAVFSITFRRYLDLKKAEAQTRESQIEAALERVRSRTLAMQKSDELAETAAEVFRQLIALGIEPNRLYIGIIKGKTGDMEMWATDEDGTQIGKKFMFNKNENTSVKKLYDGWETKQVSVIVNMEGKELEDYFHYLNHVMHIPFKGGLTQTRRVQSVAYFSKGFIGMASPDGQGDETIQLLERFAAVFNLTFTRFNDLKIAEAHAEQAELDLIQLKEEKKRTEDALNELQITQKQLIQSEKMASLGELTAGIAHEIQNPLNFVNNFSEVSTELVDEMNEEIKKGNLEDAQQIAKDLKDNLEKINHHGKRAGDIVKGMLQHSRSSSGVKEPTDINALADEYLRLAYHGLRAKDKSFNATLITDFDDSIGMIDMIPQDIGRVILNLITNAFYVVDEKKKQTGGDYESTVSVSTKKNNGKVEISVKDNGNGIPAKVLDKIFQPFFTTKPTGQGTGLGLSLSYDIVKAHGGELKVETKEGEGTEFIIQLSN